MQKYILALILFLNCLFFNAQNFDKQVGAIKTPEALNKYWQTIFLHDQAKRGLKSIDSNDNHNFKQVITSINQLGYPPNDTSDFVNPIIVPNVVFTHQRAQYVNEYYFPVFYQAYKTGKADTAMFCHNVKGLFYGRFQRNFIRDRDIKPTDIDTMLKLMKPYLNTRVDCSIAKFDSICANYKAYLNSITQSALIYRWQNKFTDTYSIYKYNNKFYFHKLWRDGSNAMPQQIIFSNKNQFAYSYQIYNDYFKITENKNLEIYTGGKKTEEASPTP